MKKTFNINKTTPNILIYILLVFISNLFTTKLIIYGLVIDIIYFILFLKCVHITIKLKEQLVCKELFLLGYPFIIFLNILLTKNSFSNIILILLGIIFLFFYISLLYEDGKKFFLYIASIFYIWFILLVWVFSLNVDSYTTYKDKSYVCREKHDIIMGRVYSAGAMDSYHFEVIKKVELINIKYILKIEWEKYYSNQQEEYENYDCRR